MTSPSPLHITEIRILFWLANRVKITYCSCQIGPGISSWHLGCRGLGGSLCSPAGRRGSSGLCGGRRDSVIPQKLAQLVAKGRPASGAA
jgi:hypothetical protein